MSALFFRREAPLDRYARIIRQEEGFLNNNFSLSARFINFCVRKITCGCLPRQTPLDKLRARFVELKRQRLEAEKECTAGLPAEGEQRERFAALQKIVENMQGLRTSAYYHIRRQEAKAAGAAAAPTGEQRAQRFAVSLAHVNAALATFDAQLQKEETFARRNLAPGIYAKVSRALTSGLVFKPLPEADLDREFEQLVRDFRTKQNAAIDGVNELAPQTQKQRLQTAALQMRLQTYLERADKLFDLEEKNAPLQFARFRATGSAERVRTLTEVHKQFKKAFAQIDAANQAIKHAKQALIGSVRNAQRQAQQGPGDLGSRATFLLMPLAASPQAPRSKQDPEAASSAQGSSGWKGHAVVGAAALTALSKVSTALGFSPTSNPLSAIAFGVESATGLALGAARTGLRWTADGISWVAGEGIISLAAQTAADITEQVPELGTNLALTAVATYTFAQAAAKRGYADISHTITASGCAAGVIQTIYAGIQTLRFLQGEATSAFASAADTLPATSILQHAAGQSLTDASTSSMAAALKLAGEIAAPVISLVANGANAAIRTVQPLAEEQPVALAAAVATAVFAGHLIRKNGGVMNAVNNTVKYAIVDHPWMTAAAAVTLLAVAATPSAMAAGVTTLTMTGGSLSKKVF